MMSIYCFYEKRVMLLRILLVLVAYLLPFYLESWFTIEIEIFTFKIPFYFFSNLFLFSFILLQYNLIRNNKSNECFNFLYWLLCFFCFTCLYFIYVKSFLIDLEYVQDQLMNYKYFVIKMHYTSEYKYNFFNEYLQIYLKKHSFYIQSPEIIHTIVLETMKDFCLNNPDTTISEIKEYTPMLIMMCDLVYNVVDSDSFSEYQKMSYHLFQGIRNILLTIILFKFSMFLVPKTLLYLFFNTKALTLAKNTLASSNAIFMMSAEEYSDFCYLAAVYLMKNSHPWEIIFS